MRRSTTKTTIYRADVGNDDAVMGMMFTAAKHQLRNQQSASVVTNDDREQLGVFLAVEIEVCDYLKVSYAAAGAMPTPPVLISSCPWFVSCPRL